MTVLIDTDSYLQCASCQRTQVEGQVHWNGKTFCDQYCRDSYDRFEARNAEIRLQEGLLDPDIQ